jgi:hypothetical protein
MTINISFASAGGGYLESKANNYADARDSIGSGAVHTTDGTARWGQVWLGDGFYYVQESFHSFTYSVDSSVSIVSAYIRLTCESADSEWLDRWLTIQEYDWGGTLDASDWRSSSFWGSGPFLADYYRLQAAGNRVAMSGNDLLVSRLGSAGPLRVVGRSDRAANGIISAQGVGETGVYYSSSAGGASSDPTLVWLTVPKSTHEHVSGAQVRLSTGGWAYLESNGATPPVVTLYYCTPAGSTSSIGVLPIGTSSSDFAATPGLQSLALVSDTSDNLYVIGAQGSSTNYIAARAYVKGAGTTWTPAGMLAGAMPAYDGAGINQAAAAWHNVGSSGTIMAMVGRGVGKWDYAPFNDISYALLNCAALKAGSGTLIRNSGGAVGVLVDQVAPSGYYSHQANETATGLDVQAPSSAARRGYVMCWNGQVEAGSGAWMSPCRYTLSWNGTSLQYTSLSSYFRSYATKDASCKARILAISDTVLAAVTMDPDAGWGPTLSILQNVGTSTSWTNLGYITLDGKVSSLPSSATMAATAAWDAIYDPTDNKVWLYYIDKNDARRIMRTSVSLTTALAVRDEVEIVAALGSAGSVCRSLRVERCARSGDTSILLSIAVDTAGTLTNEYFIDSFNVAPSAPTLTVKTNFDATAATDFTWTFNDLNAWDSQSAFQLDINTAAGADVYDTGKMGAAITYVAAGVAATGNNASLEPALPAGVAQGDLLIILASIRNSGTGTVDTPTGWTSLASSGNVSLLGRIMRSNDTAPTVTFTGGAAGADTLAQMAALRGTDQDIAAVVDAVATQLNGSAQNIATPGITTTVPGCAVLRLAWKQDDWSDLSVPSNYTSVGTAVSTAGSDAAQGWVYRVLTSATTLTSGSHTVTGGAAAISRALAVAIRPYQAPTTESFTLPADMIDNSASYQWRVRTYDVSDSVSPWANYSTFQASASGNVTITDPASDNPSGVLTSEYDIDWSVSGTTQVDYRVVVTRSDTSAVLVDTGWVTDTVTTYAVAGMLSDVQYQIAVTVRNGALVESGTGLRLITPSYAFPETPLVTVTPVTSGGYMLISVTNPAPGTTALGTSPYGFEDDVAAMTGTDCTVTQSSTQAYLSTYSAKMEVTGTPAQAYMRPTYATEKVAVEAGTRYTVSYYAYSPAGYANLVDAIDWFDVDDVYVDTSTNESSAVSGAWVERNYTVEAPAGSAYAIYGPTLASSPGAGTILYVDELLLAIASDQPTPSANEIHRRVVDSTTTEILTTAVAVDGTWRDYTAASGTAYEYMARAVALAGSADSDWETGTLTLTGVWLHDPLDPQTTSFNLPYGRSQRSSSTTVTSGSQLYAGRTWPVIDYGDTQNNVLNVQATIPNGTTWASDLVLLEALITARRTIMIRDNRRRVMYATLDGYNETDVDEGTNVSFTATQVDVTEVTS